MEYNYDNLLQGHFKKAFWGMAGRAALGAGRMALNAGKGMMGMGASQGAGALARGANLAGRVGGVAAPVAGMMAAGNNNPGIINPISGNKMGSENPHFPPSLVDASEHKGWHRPDSIIHPVVDLVGLGLLGRRPLHHLLHNKDPEARTDAKYELAGLSTLAVPSAITAGTAAYKGLKGLLHR